jgi:hypothetical protein
MSDQKYLIVHERGKLPIEAQDHQQALAGAPERSVTNGSKCPVRIRVRFQLGTGHLQRVFTQNLLLKSKHFLLQLST